MTRKTTITTIALLLVLCAEAYVPDHVPVFPQPQRLEAGTKARQVSTALSLTIDGSRCTGECETLVRSAFERVVIGAMRSQVGLARWRLSLHPEVDAIPPATPTPGLAQVSTLRVVFVGSGNVLPELRGLSTEEEWHDISVGTSGDAVIRVQTAWGALRAFETVAQLAEWDDANTRFVVGRLPLVVEDWPRFSWRGILFDTSRHFLPLAKLKQLVDALAAMKLNVVHLHISDAQSFPLVVESVPGLDSGTGAYNSTNAVYTHADIADLVAHARTRGVMLVPEIDIPAHTASWRFADPDIVADCWDYARAASSVYSENILALNPASTKTWNIITNILTETAHIFNSPYLHVGGDEVVLKCWETCKQKDAINAWMKARGLTKYAEVEGVFDRFAQNVSLSTGKRPIVWEDAYTNGNLVAKDTIVGVWRSKATLAKVVKAGYNAILSAGYYLDMQAPTCGGASTCHVNWMWSWTARDMYKFDPVADLGLNTNEIKRVLGGEAAMWAESIDQTNIDAMALSRLVAVAERLWSSQNITDANNLEVRTQRFRCLSLRRGISGAGSLSSDYCEYKWPFPTQQQQQVIVGVLADGQNSGKTNVAIIATASACGGFLVTVILAGVIFFVKKRSA